MSKSWLDVRTHACFLKMCKPHLDQEVVVRGRHGGVRSCVILEREERRVLRLGGAAKDDLWKEKTGIVVDELEGEGEDSAPY